MKIKVSKTRRIICPWCKEEHFLLYADGKPVTQGLKSSNPDCYIHVTSEGLLTHGRSVEIFELEDEL